MERKYLNKQRSPLENLEKESETVIIRSPTTIQEEAFKNILKNILQSHVFMFHMLITVINKCNTRNEANFKEKKNHFAIQAMDLVTDGK